MGLTRGAVSKVLDKLSTLRCVVRECAWRRQASEKDAPSSS
jgi:hypothetical protein